MTSQAELFTALTTANDSITSMAPAWTKSEPRPKASKRLWRISPRHWQYQTTPEVDAALATLQASVASVASRVKAVDDLVPDAPVTP